MRLSKAVCGVVAETFTGSHEKIEALFRSAGVKDEPPNLPHHSKWKEWLFRVGQDSTVDSLGVVGNLLEEFMDLAPPSGTSEHELWTQKRARVEQVLEENGLRYYRFGQVIPVGEIPMPPTSPTKRSSWVQTGPAKPDKVEELLETLVRGLRRAMHPLAHRRKGRSSLSFSDEYDVQDLLHALLRPWIKDVRPEEFTPSYAGASTRMDFLLPAHELVIETKIVRDRAHAKEIGSELIIDIEHYRRHPKCRTLWCVIYDPEHLITNAEGLKADLEGTRSTPDGEVRVRLFPL
jgi:hypothetical protein